jgi:16S rRNA (guanine527-N7)-methyltransferase
LTPLTKGSELSKSKLAEGILALRRGDEEIERLISPKNDEIIALLERYIKEIELFNKAYGLVGTDDRDELIIKHILDSLAPLGIISRLLAETGKKEERAQIADAGSGAGLPGIPLSIVLRDCGFTLIERMGRRAGFLLNTKAVLGLSNVTVEEKELERADKGRFSLVTFRAFKPLEPKLLETLSGACQSGGIIAAYKGKREKTEQEMAKIEKYRDKWEIIPYKVPFLNEDERHILVIKTQDKNKDSR